MHPRPLAIIAALFMISGIAALIGIGADLLLHQRIDFDLGALNFWVGRWLFAHDRRGREWAFFITQIQLVLLPLAGFILMLGNSVDVNLLGVRVAQTAPLVGCVFMAAVWTLNLWQYRVLDRADIRALFRGDPETVRPLTIR